MAIRSSKPMDRRYITSEQRVRQSLTVDQMDPLAVEQKIKKLAFNKRISQNTRAEGLASILGYPASPWGAEKVLQAMKWKPFEDEWRRIRTDFVRGRWNSPTPEYRVTLPLVHRWEQPAMGEAEDYYAWAIILLIDQMEWRVDSRSLVGWIRRAEDEEEMTFIFYHLLLFQHYQEKAELWKDQSLLRKLFNTLTCKARKEV